MTPKTTMKKPPCFSAYRGNIRSPTTLLLVRPGPGHCVCFCLKTRPRWTLISATSRPGMSSTWAMKNRLMMIVPGNSPPKIDEVTQEPITGMDSMIAEAIRRPVPERPSSGSE
jgi:hypothetical protein